MCACVPARDDPPSSFGYPEFKISTLLDHDAVLPAVMVTNPFHKLFITAVSSLEINGPTKKVTVKVQNDFSHASVFELGQSWTRSAR